MTEQSVLESTLEIFSQRGITKIFGNPGSNEIPFLAGLGSDIEFVLGLHEQVVLGLAEGYSRATGQAALVNLHAASGTGNAMGALTNARYGHVPIVVLAGQQVRRTVGQEVMLSNVDATLLPQPLVKYSHEPLAPEDVPRTLSQAIIQANTHPRGPVYVSVPLDDWATPALESDRLLGARTVTDFSGLDEAALRSLASELDGAKRLAIVVGPQVDAAAVVDASVFDAVVELAERLDAAVFIAPSPDRCSFPTTHPNFAGVLVPGIRSVQERLADSDAVLVLGSAVFRYHRWEPGPYLSEGGRVIQITQDHREAARAPYGSSYIADVGVVTGQLANAVADRGRRRGQPGSRVFPEPLRSEHGMTGSQILAVLNEQVTDAVAYVNETTTLDLDYLERIAIDRPGMYHFPASGGLGFGLPVAVGLALGAPEKTIVATVGDGSANYGISALYTAAEHQTRTIFVIVNNGGYGALAGFASRMGAEQVPGLTLREIDFVSLAEGYGVPASRVSSRDEFARAYAAALSAVGPVLIDARVT
ncbi:benzoylformate decarboxylase [Leucobacter sp. M11]|uniref:benzoylformate decarboxylase n=1 Tax=Leucobacter sp. M11 TaxID=2993565 RepID=UPI002D81159F|nr:benzoylformate decarboxylase [Leucobacter sp. M11]MEB4614941.1 benzoylformate decarboxylase [Leucobacter sp. M11]